MLFVAIYNLKPGASITQALQKRMEWKPPEGMKKIAEYWLQSNTPHTVVIFEADNFGQMMAANAQWRDLYDFTVFPAITGEEGLKLAKQMMPKT